MKNIIYAIALISVLGFTSSPNAALINNGGGLIYDTDLNITFYMEEFVQEGVGNNGTWSTVNTWVSSLTVEGTNAGTWRLPLASNSGYGTNEGEMGHLFYAELGGSEGVSIKITHNANYALFPYMLAGGYWTGTPANPNNDNNQDGVKDEKDANYTWRFDFSDGHQYLPPEIPNDSVDGLAIAVHVGNVGGTAVPEPNTILLLCLGMIGIAGFRKKIK